MTVQSKLQSAAVLLLCLAAGGFHLLRQSHAESPSGSPASPAVPSRAPEPVLKAPDLPGNPESAAGPAAPVSASALAPAPAPAAAASSAGAGVPGKVGIVDMSRIFTAYHKTAEMEKKLNEDKSKAKKEMDTRTAQYQELAARLAKMEKVMKDRLVNEQLKHQTRLEAQEVLRQANGMAQSIQEFAGRRERQLQDHYTRMRRLLVEDILVRLREKAKRDNYDFVFDKSGMGISGSFMLPVSREAFDFSSEVIEELNRNAPAPGAAAASSAP